MSENVLEKMNEVSEGDSQIMTLWSELFWAWRCSNEMPSSACQRNIVFSLDSHAHFRNEKVENILGGDKEVCHKDDGGVSV